ncbi:LANO_0B00914g1_1 [Lachancea nothofagi CBS 11611]|uniref:LANO_0B00914g1_1 n=1 Tax=Lachancea nothofagi CBS 11611 TaxID=1266666 RepID=A0A1G4IUR6_9SACH|nr:LANO_0B00914g1_1 [Lachancea nothofagi CBS 11611]
MFKPTYLRRFKRLFHGIKISDEVKNALAIGKPVVALESTIITHGLPFPQNLEMAMKVESLIRQNNAIPATIAFIDGVPTVGLGASELERLADTAGSDIINKVSRRDIAYTIANKQLGGTTISSTMILSHMAGIKVFATGGLGGVHRGAEVTMDISADLEELGRTPVAVVCAGPKAILDIEKTMEYLETQGCMVATYGPAGTNVPGFYTRNSGVSSPYNFETFAQAAQIIHAGRTLGLDSGYLMCVPPPTGVALSDSLIESIIDKATHRANELGIRGKELTPFLLSKIAQDTEGLSVKSNIEFVLNNAKAGAQIALELSKLEKQDVSKQKTHIPQFTFKGGKTNSCVKNTKDVSVVVGAVALDTHCSISNKTSMHDSNPGNISAAIGGVAYNVALAAHWSNKYPTVSTKLLTSVGNDLPGSAILKDLELSTDTIYVDDKNPTAQYVSMLSNDGELIVACADMQITTKMPDQFLLDRLESIKPKLVIVDANVATQTLQLLLKLQTDLNFKLIFEPTSDAKAKKLSTLKGIEPFPNHKFYLITPTVSELQSIYYSFGKVDKFDVDKWFPILDSLQVDTAFRNEQNKGLSKIIRDAIKKGVFQMAFNLLPYFPKMVVKDGPNGLFVFTLKEDMADRDSTESFAHYSFVSRGFQIGDKQMGMMFEHYEVPDKTLTVKNVTGAGDTFLGVLSNDICHKGDIFSLNATDRFASINRAQLGAKMTVEDYGAVSKCLKQLN